MGEYEKLGRVAGLVPDSVSDETAPYAEMTEEYQRSLEAFRETTGLLGATGSQLMQWAERMFRLLEAQKAQVGQVGMQYAQALKSFDTARGEFAQLSPELMTPAEKESLGQIKVVYKNGEMMSGAELVDSIAAERNLRREALAGQALKAMNKALGEFSGTVERLQSEIGSVRNSPEVVHGVPSNGTWGIMGVLRGIGVSGGGGGRGLGGGGGFGGLGGLPGSGLPGGPSMPGVPGGSGLRGGVLPGGPGLPSGPGLPGGVLSGGPGGPVGFGPGVSGQPLAPVGPGLPGVSGGGEAGIGPMPKVHLQLRPDGPVTGYTPPAVNQLDSPAWRSDYQIPGLPKPPSHGLAGGVLGGVSAGGAALASRLGPSSTAAAVGRVAPMGGVMGMPGLGAPTTTGGARVGGARPPVGGMLAPGTGGASAGGKTAGSPARSGVARPGVARAGMGPVSVAGATNPAGKPASATGSARPAGGARPVGGVWGANSTAGGKDQKDQRASRPHLLGYQPTRLTEEDAPQIDPSIYGAGNAQSLRPAARDDSDEW